MTLSRLISVLGLDTVTSQIILLLLKLVSKGETCGFMYHMPFSPTINFEGSNVLLIVTFEILTKVVMKI